MALINCPKCGGVVSDKATKCPHCGSSTKEVNTPTKNEQVYKTKHSNTSKWVLSTVSLVIASIAIVAIFVTQHNSNKDNTDVSEATEITQNGIMEINAYIYDSDGDFTNIRNAPKGKVIDKIPTGQGRYGAWLDKESGGWYHIKNSKVFDFEKGISRELNSSDCWIHESIVVFK